MQFIRLPTRLAAPRSLFPKLSQAVTRKVLEDFPRAETKSGPHARTDRYGLVAIVLHWLIAALIFTLFGIGWYMGALPNGPERSWYIALHKSIGITVFGLAVSRLVWRLTHQPPPFPRSMPPWERKAALLNHYILYTVMFIQPISGYLSSSFSGYKTRYFGIPLPHWGWKDEILNLVFNAIHVTNSYILFALIVIHIMAALRHLMIKRDRVFQRMLPLIGPHRRG